MGIRRSRFGVEVAEDFCFECKDSGDDLRVCEYLNCLKSYHPHCTVRKEGDDFPPGEKFICNWHTCVDCRKSPDCQCLCCPNASVCQNCLGKVEFFKVEKQNKVLCRFCLDLAISIEKNDVDPRAKSNDQDSDVSLVLFKDYWNTINDTERLTLVDLQEASGLVDRGLNCTREADSEKFPDEDNKTDEDLLVDSDDNEQTFPSGLKSKPDKTNTSMKRKRSKKKTFVGWGTEELIEFLSCFDKDTKEPLDEAKVVGVVREYIKQKGLFLGEKKKYFECDDKLRPLFTRRKVRYSVLHSKLRMHLAENAVSEDENLDGSEEDDGPKKKKPQASLEAKIAKRVSERNKRCLASLNQHNIELIYLRKKLVAGLLKHEDTFKQKVVGCFVRVKNNVRSHFLQKSKRSFQLGLVTGTKKSQEKYRIMDIDTDVLLCVTGFCDDVKLTMLSEEDIQEEECKELIPLVEEGILQRATVVEFEEKVAAVHTDIVNHWIDRELKRLDNDIDIANEKGWRQQMVQLMDKKRLLSTPAERHRLLERVREIVVDAEDEKDTELKITAGNSCQENRGKESDRTVCFVDMKEKSKEATPPVADSFDLLKEKPPKVVTENASESFELLKEKRPEGAADQVADSLRVCEKESPEGAIKKMAHSYSLSINAESSEVASKQGDATREVAFEAGEVFSSGVTPDPVLNSPVAQDGSKTQAIDIDKDESYHTQRNKSSKMPVCEVINLDGIDDEDDDQPGHDTVHRPGAMNGSNHRMEPESALSVALRAQFHWESVYHRESVAVRAIENGMPHQSYLWHYADPKGNSQGPFLLAQLWGWKTDGYFGEDFKVWRTGQTKEHAILLTEAYRRFY